MTRSSAQPTQSGSLTLADDPTRRRTVAVGGYTTTAVLSALIGTAGNVVQVGVLRGASWARGLRVPARNALLADVVPAGAYGRAYGFERTMDNLGAIGGPLLDPPESCRAVGTRVNRQEHHEDRGPPCASTTRTKRSTRVTPPCPTR